MNPPSIESKPWKLETDKREGIEGELGTLFVPENRSQAKSRTIAVRFVRFRAPQPTGTPPTIHLPSGPGGSFLGDVGTSKNSTSVPLAGQLENIKRLLSVSDVIYIDQRGFSRPEDRLTFSHPNKAHPPQEPDSVARQKDNEIAFAKAAVDHYKKQEVDLSGYDIKELAADVNDLRKTLGYDRVILVGYSFGTQWAFAIIRLFPQIVARALLSGIEPLGCAYDRPAEVFSVMQEMWAHADQQPEFKKYLPRGSGGITGAVRSIVAELERAPRIVRIVDSETNDEVDVTLGREDFQIDPQLTDEILEIYHRLDSKWAKRTWARRKAGITSAILIQRLIDSSLGATEHRRRLVRSDFGVTLMRDDAHFEAFMAAEHIWPTKDVGDDFRTEIRTDTPILFIQGTWDYITPINNLLQLLPYFVNSRTLIVEHGLHAPWDQALATRPDVAAAVMDFVQTGSTVNLPSSISLQEPGMVAPRFRVGREAN